MDRERFPQLLRAIYDAVDALEDMFPGRHFTPDGHMVGSLGEALAAHYYGISLSSASTECHDGSCSGRMVQVKATQGDRIAVSSEPDHMLVVRPSIPGITGLNCSRPAAGHGPDEAVPLPSQGRLQRPDATGSPHRRLARTRCVAAPDGLEPELHRPPRPRVTHRRWSSGEGPRFDI